MTSKNDSSNNGGLMDNLKSIKDTLDENDDSIPLLGEEDVPMLGEDDDIPVLGADTTGTEATESKETDVDRASLEAALAELESMELAPKARKKKAQHNGGIEEKIKANAAPPSISEEELAKTRDNPFLNKNQKDQLEQSRRLREEAALISSLSKQKKPLTATPQPEAPAPTEPEAIEFTDNPFLKASAAPATTETDTEKPKTEEKSEPDHQVEAADKSNTDKGGLGDIILPEEDDSLPANTKNLSDADADKIIEETIEEYMVILEAALRKKLKEKIPNLLK